VVRPAASFRGRCVGKGPPCLVIQASSVRVSRSRFRLGSRPFTLPEMRKLYEDDVGKLHTVGNQGKKAGLPAGQIRTPTVAGPVFRKPGG